MLNRLAKGAGINLAGTLLGKGFLVVNTLFLARFLAANELGLYFLCFSMTEMTSIICMVGLRVGVIRYVSIYQGKGDILSVRKILLGALSITIIISIFTTIGIYLVRDLVSNVIFNKPGLLPILPFFLFSIPMIVAKKILLASTEGLKFMHYSVFVEQIFVHVVRFLLFLVFLVHLKMNLLGTGVAYLLTSAVSLLLALHFCSKHISFKLKTEGEKFYIKDLIKFSLPMMPASLIFGASKQLDVLMIGWLSSAVAVGLYSIAIRLVMFIEIVFSAFQLILNPYIADLNSRGRRKDLKDAFHFSSKWGFIASIPIFVLLIAYPNFLLSIFNQTAIAGSLCLSILAISHFMTSLSGLSSSMIFMTGHSKLSLLNNAIFISINAILNYFLISKYGIIGAAVAHSISVFILAALRFYQVHILLNLTPFTKAHFRTVLITIGAMIPMLFIREIISIDNACNIIIPFLIFLVLFFLLNLLFNIERPDRILFNSVKMKIAKIKICNISKENGRN